MSPSTALVGTWELVSRIDRTPSGERRAEPSASGPDNSRAVGGHDACFGTFTVDDAKGTVTQRLTGALSRENVGQVLTRAMTVEGDTLTIALDTATARGEAVTRTLVWKRVA